MFEHLDYSAFQFINHLTVSDRFLNPLMIFLAERAEYLFFAGLLFYWFFHQSKHRRMIVEAILSACVALIINMLIGMFFYRDRPFVAHHVHWLIPHARNASFPSDHATAAFVIAASIYIWKKRDGWAWLVLAAGISLSRVWTGVHYPADVLAGMMIGAGTAFIVHTFAVKCEFLNRLIGTLIELYEKVEGTIIKRKKAMK